MDFCDLCRITGDDIDDAKQQQHQQLQLDTDTVIIGNGPAGIALSSMLSGWHPFYDPSNPHPDLELHERISQCTAAGQSLLFQDLSSLASMAQTELNNNLTPFAAFYDSLARPVPSDPLHPSCLQWRRLPSEAIPHIVLGDSSVGGSWTEYEDEMNTVSIANWMDLPGYSLAMDFVADPEFAKKRPNARIFKHYLLAYCLVMGIDQQFRQFTRVTQIQKFCHRQNGQEFWELHGLHTVRNEPFTLRCRNVVLACGQSHPRLLKVPGELNSTSVVYDSSALKRAIEETKDGDGEEKNGGDEQAEEEKDAILAQLPSAQGRRPVIVIGDGISAADAVLCCLDRGCPVLHVIRRNERQLRNVMLSRLSPSVYPEYSRVYQLMTGRVGEAGYRRMIGANVLAIEDDLGQQMVTLETPDGIVQEPYRCVSICIGRRSELPLIKGLTEFGFSTNYQSTTDPSLFAIGALAGDHFVRYLVGGALCVAQKLAASQKERRQREKMLPFMRHACCIGLEASIDGRGTGPVDKRAQRNVGMMRTNSATPLKLAMTVAEMDTRFMPAISRAKSTMQLVSAAILT